MLWKVFLYGGIWIVVLGGTLSIKDACPVIVVGICMHGPSWGPGMGTEVGAGKLRVGRVWVGGTM